VDGNIASFVPFVSAIMPCRNEERFIVACLDSLISNDYPKEQVEILVVDGASTDQTCEIVHWYTQNVPFIRLLTNPKKIIPAGMNVGIQHARGDVILKIDAHSTYASDYISKCVRFLQDSGADNVGGVLVTRPSADTAVAHAIALTLAHPFGSGNSHFRVGYPQPRWSDTAAFGCYRKDTFTRVGLYNENLVRSSDMDLNARIRHAGGKILLVPEIVAHYYPRAKLGEFLIRNMVDGFWAIYPIKYGSRGVGMRHLVPLTCLLIALASLIFLRWTSIFIGVLSVFVGTYLFLTVGVSFCVARREQKPKLLCLLPIVFVTRHLAYAIGSLWGLFRAGISLGFWQSLGIRSRWHEASL